MKSFSRHAREAWEVPRDLLLGRYPEFVTGGGLPRGHVPVFVFHSLEPAGFGKKLAYLAPAMDRTLAAVVHLYLERAGMEIPPRLQDILFASDAVTCDPIEESHGDPRATANA